MSNLMRDKEGRSWLIDFGGLKKDGEPIFEDAAKWLCSGLFLFSENIGTTDVEAMQRLARLVASIPNLSVSLPDPPADCTPAAGFIWDFVDTMIKVFQKYSQHILDSMQLPELQFLWAFLCRSVPMITYVRNTIMELHFDTLLWFRDSNKK